MKKILQNIASVVMLIIFLQSSTFLVFANENVPVASSTTETENGIAYSGACGAEGDNITWTYDPDTQTLTFSGTGAMASYYDPNPPAGSTGWKRPEWNYGNSIRHVVYEEGITDIDYVLSGFFDCDSTYPADSCTITLPESVTEWKGSLPTRFLIYAPYGSAIYYRYANDRNYRFIGKGVAQHPLYETTGTSKLGGSWCFEYVTVVLNIQGPGFVDYAEIPNYPFDCVVIASDITIPDNPSDSEQEFNSYVFKWANATCEMDMGTYFRAARPIYYEEDSEFESAYTEVPESFLAGEKTGICFNESETPLIGDANLDGKVDVTDAVLLNKAANGSVMLNDLQRNNMDCNGDGTISVDDGLALLRYLVHLEESLPIA